MAWGRADSAPTMSSSCSLAPQCSLHLIFQKHQHIRKEICPEIAVWMNVTFVSQRQKLEELMCLRLTASSHGPPSQTVHTLGGGAQGDFCLDGKIQLSRQILNETRKKKEGRTGSLAKTHHLLCARSTVPFHVQNTYYHTHFREEKISSKRGCVILPKTQS